MVVTVQELKEFTNNDAVKELADASLDGAIMLAEAKLKEAICDKDLAKLEDDTYPEEILFSIKRLAEYYAFNLGEESRVLNGMESERMGNYSYTRAKSSDTVTDILDTLWPILSPHNKCEVRGANVVRMRRL